MTFYKRTYRGTEQPEHRADTDVSPGPVPWSQLRAAVPGRVVILGRRAQCGAAPHVLLRKVLPPDYVCV